MNPFRVTIEREFDHDFMQSLFEMVGRGIAYWASYQDIEEPVEYYDDEQTTTTALHIVEDEVVIGQKATREVTIDATLLNLGISRILTGETPVQSSTIGNIALAVITSDANLLDEDDVDLIVQAGLYNDIVWG